MANSKAAKRKQRSRKVRVLQKRRKADRSRKATDAKAPAGIVQRAALASNGHGSSEPQAIVSRGPEVLDSEQLLARAQSRDIRMRELERLNVATWSEMAELAMAVRDDLDWKRLGFSSWNKWMEDAAPQSRASMYAGVGLLEALKEDVSKEDLKQIPMSTAKVMKSLPKKMRRDRQLVEKAKSLQPKKFVAEIQNRAPELHIETLAPRKLGFSRTQAQIVDGACEAYREIEQKPDASDEECIEAFAADWLIGHKDAYDALKAAKAAGGVQ